MSTIKTNITNGLIITNGNNNITLATANNEDKDVMDFNAYLHIDRNNIVTLDLSKYSVAEIIAKMCEVKAKNHPTMLKNYSMAVFQLHRVEKEFDCVVDPIIITEIFWQMFIPYMADKGLKYSTIKTVCSQILSALNWAAKYSVKLSPTYNELDIPKYKSVKVALTPDEVSHLYHFDLTKLTVWSKRHNRFIKVKSNKLKTLENVRDMFVLSCNLGQRYSDMRRIGKKCFKGNIFSMVQLKTGNKCRVNLDMHTLDKRTTMDILQKYDYNAPYTGDVSNYDHYLKELFQMLHGTFDDVLHCENKLQGEIKVDESIKWKLIASHTGRRTFATANALRNVPRREIMKATGHNTEESFIRYICDDIEISDK